MWGGGVDSTHFGKCTVTPPNFILEQQTESYMKAEVFRQNLITYRGCWDWNCGLGRSPKWPRSRRKKIDKKSWNQQFLRYKNVIHLKRKLRTIVIQIWNKIRDFYTEKIEKSRFRDFRSQNIKMSCRSRLNFWKTYQDSKKNDLTKVPSF